MSEPATSDAGKTAQAPRESGALDAIFGGLKRQWLLAALLSTFAGVAAGSAYFASQPITYTTFATLHVGYASRLLGEESRGDREIEEYTRTQAALIKSRPVVTEALAQKKVAETRAVAQKPDAVTWLESGLKTSYGDGNMLRVALTAEEPAEAALVLNAVVDAYLSKVVDAEKNKQQAVLNELDIAAAGAEGRMREQKETLRRLAESLRVTGVEARTLKQQMVIQDFSTARRELMKIEADIRTANAKLAISKARVEGVKSITVPDQAVAQRLAADPQVSAAAAEVERIKDIVKQTTQASRGESVELTRAQSALREAEARLAQLRETKRGPVVEQLRDATANDAAQSAAELNAQLQTLKSQQSYLVPEVKRLSDEADKVGLTSFEMELKQAEIAQADDIIKQLRSKRERMHIEIQSYKRRVEPVHLAEPASAKPTSNVSSSLGCAAAGFVLTALAVGFVESRRRRVTATADLTRIPGLTLLGCVPKLSSDLDSDPFGDAQRPHHEYSDLLESVNDIRAVLQYSERSVQHRVFLVASAMPGEGKTTVAGLLATSLAATGRKTLLIDGDLRNPQISLRSGLAAATPGLGEVLRGEIELKATIVKTPQTGLSLLPAGKGCERTTRGLTAENMRRVIDVLRRKYHYIIIDTCPIIPVSDGLVLGKAADSALIVVRTKVSQDWAVSECYRKLSGIGVPVLGAILNCAPPNRKKYRYASDYARRSPAPEAGVIELAASPAADTAP